MNASKVNTIKILSQLGIACSVFFFLALVVLSSIYVTLNLFSLSFSSIPPFVPFPGWGYYFSNELYIGTISSYVLIAFSILIFILSVTISILFQQVNKDPIFQTIDKQKINLYSILTFFLTTFMFIPTLKLSKTIIKKYELFENTRKCFVDEEKKKKYLDDRTTIIYGLNITEMVFGIPMIIIGHMLFAFIVSHHDHTFILINFIIFMFLLALTYINAIALAAVSLILAKSRMLNKTQSKSLMIFGILYLFFTIITTFTSLSFVKKLNDEYKLEEEILPIEGEVAVIKDDTLYISRKPTSPFFNEEENNIKKIKKLHDLYVSGAISQAEYEKYKAMALEEEMNKLK